MSFLLTKSSKRVRRTEREYGYSAAASKIHGSFAPLRMTSCLVQCLRYKTSCLVQGLRYNTRHVSSRLRDHTQSRGNRAKPSGYTGAKWHLLCALGRNYDC